MLAGVPVVAAIAALLSLRRVQVSPLTEVSEGQMPLDELVGGGAVVSCSAMRALAVLGHCAPGLAAVQAQDGSLFVDNAADNAKPFIDRATPAYPGMLSALPLQAVLVQDDNLAALERVRTYLAVNVPPKTSPAALTSPTPPRTFGETIQIRLARTATVEKIVYAAGLLRPDGPRPGRRLWASSRRRFRCCAA
jgi:hypothetical protein